MDPSSGWNRVVRSLDTLGAHSPDAVDAAETTLRLLAGHLEGQRTVPAPVVDRPEWLTARWIDRLRQDAETQIRRAGEPYNGKTNAPPGPAVERLLRSVDIDAWFRSVTGLAGYPVHSDYVHYEERQDLGLHLDADGFGSAIALICLTHDHDPECTSTSRTVFVHPGGRQEIDTVVGDALLFDGRHMPHGRSRLSPGERITILSFGFRLGTRYRLGIPRGGHRGERG